MSLITYLNPIAIKDASIPGSKLQDASIPGSKLQDGSISGSKLQDASIQGSKLQENTVEVSKIISLAQSITWSDLKDKRDAGKLIPGTYYRITDYQCTTTQANTKSAGHQFDIIARADDVNVLNEECWAAQHEGDEYFANSNLSAWKLCYCLNNDTNRFAWAINEETKIGEILNSGTYVYTKPVSKITVFGNTYNLEIGVRTLIHNSPQIYITKIDDYTVVLENEYNYATVYVYTYETGRGVIYRMIDEWNNDIPYDFKNIQFLRVDANTVTVIRGEYYNDYSAEVESFFNSTKNILPFKYQYLKWYDSVQAAQEGFADLLGMTEEELESSGLYYCILDDKEWLEDPGLLASVESITADNGKWLFTFNTDTFNDSSLNGYANNVYSNEIGPYLIDGAIHLNNICFCGSNCHNNTFGSNCSSNTFGSSCYYNTFGSSCYSSTFGSSFSSNSFGSYCFSNTFGSYCSSNTFGSSCFSNTFGSSCYNNTFGSNCASNSFGEYCSNNSFGSYCRYIKFSSDSSATTKYNYYQYNHFGDGCNYILFKDAETASSSAQIQNYNFSQGLQGTSNAYLTVDGVRNRAYETKVAQNSNGELKIYCEADLIK